LRDALNDNTLVVQPSLRHAPTAQRPDIQAVAHRTSVLSRYNQVIVDLISNTQTDTGLTVRCELDTKPYPKGVTVSDQDMADINLVRDAFHGDWNYTIRPRNQPDQAIIP